MTPPKSTWLWTLACAALLVGCSDNDTTLNDPTPQTDTTPPAVPANLEIVDVEGEIALDWDDNAEVDLAGYALERSTDEGATWTTVEESPIVDSEFVDTYRSLVSYRIASLDVSENQSAFSDRVGYVAVGVPPGKINSNPATP